MKWSKMGCDSYKNRNTVGGVLYEYACETSLYENDDFKWDSDRLGFICRWKSLGGGGSVYHAWVKYGGELVDLGWFDFDPSCGDGQMNHCSSLKELKAFVEDQHKLLNKTV